MATYRFIFLLGPIFYLAVGASLVPDVERKPKSQEAIKIPNFEPDGSEEVNGIPVAEVEGDSRGLKPSDATLLASTIDGSLVAIDQNSGEILWTINDQPVVKSPYDATKPIMPAFLPDPKDGSIYMIGGGLKEPLKKLPFTIPELVAASPCKSSDGILYTGKKIDTWFSVDKITGSKKGSISFGGCFENNDGDTCPKTDPTTFLIGRTEYNIMMYDSRAEGRRWNITFYDYSTNIGRMEVNNDYNFAHFTDSSMGVLVTVDRQSGNLLWKLSLGSPIVALYRFELEGLVNLPFTSVSKETLNNLMDQFSSPGISNEIIGETKLYPTLYVGEHKHGLFAMPSLVDKQTLTISPPAISGGRGQLLLEGPQSLPALQRPIEDSREGEEGGTLQDLLAIPIDADIMSARKAALLLGYYQVPEHSNLKLIPSMTEIQLSSKTQGSGITTLTPNPNVISLLAPFVDKQGSEYLTSPRQNHSDDILASEIEHGFNKTILDNGWLHIKSLNVSFVLSLDFLKFVVELLPYTTYTLSSIENKELKAITVLLAVGVFMLFKIFHQNVSTGGLYGSFRMSNSSVGSNSSQQTSLYEVTATAVELDNGMIKVGNITFDAGHILGKGCEGTFVYKGRFDNRDVAVKRVLAACFSIADREVDLLRESDEHPNVIRYFCMEQDRQFRYIALEFCSATLQDYIDGRYVNPGLDSITILRQATQGVQHLHNLDIVHRDIKPHNVLISIPGKRGEVRAMISDFGLCKKLKVGRMSFSRRSGIAGTEGWIAPEMMLGNRSTTCAVDVFSLGCVYYFVLTNGSHPFGESFRRQANILSGDYCLDNLAENAKLTAAKSLIEKMLSSEQTQRPTTTAILKHPLFWSNDKILNFLQDVSDRVDKEPYDSAILAAIERNKQDIVRNNWYDQLDPLVAEDLRKHRSYNGKSVRDLLRALRNKRHHYHDIPLAVKFLYGDLPDRYADYWLNRFPKLLPHAWFTMHCVKNEQNFAKYFDRNYDFVQTISKKNFLSLTSRSESNTFLPHFVNGQKFEAPPQLLELSESNHSKESVVSTWDKLKGDNDEEFQDMSSSESTGCEPFELSEINDNDQNHQNQEKPKVLPNGDIESETFFVAEQQKGLRNSPRVHRNVPQLNSENRENELKRIADQQRPSTWAQAVQKTPVNEKGASDKDYPNVEGIAKPDPLSLQSPKWILPTNTTDLFAKKRRKNKSKKAGKEV